MTTPDHTQAKDQQLDKETSLDDAALEGVVGGVGTAQPVTTSANDSTTNSTTGDTSQPPGSSNRLA